MAKDIRKYVGSKLREIRKKRGLTQKELGQLVGVKHNTISSYENGTNEPEQDILFNLANVLDVSINDFFPYKSKPSLEVSSYNYYPTSISAGAPMVAEAVTDYETEKITLPDSVMGKWAGHKDIFIMRVNGDSMNKVMPHNSLIAVKEVELSQLKNGDIVVYSDGSDYAVKRFYMYDDELIFRPDSEDLRFSEMRIPKNEAENIKIHGKVVLYIVELD